MDALASFDKIRDIVRNVLTERFPKIRVVSINVRDAYSDDGEADLLEVSIVFEAKKDDFKPEQVPDCLTAIVERLEESDETRFPILSFIAKSDLGKTKPEAA